MDALRDRAGVVGVFDDTLATTVIPDEPLCWLHISDLHVVGNDWQQDHVLRAFLRDLPRLLEQAGPAPQLVFVTGDVARHGARTDYDGAHAFLAALCEQLGLDWRQRLFVVPGNHDVDRKAISKTVARYDRAFDELDEDEFRTAIGVLIDDADDLALHGRRLGNWCEFTAKLQGPARRVSIDRPFRSDIVEVGGVTVGVASLCSAWLSGPDDARGRLVVGQRQIQLLVDELAAGGAQLRVALLHHPLDWLHEVEAKYLRALLRNEFDVMLHGHVHHPEAGAFVQGRQGTLEIGGGALYAGLGEDRFHGFTIVQVDADAGRLHVDAFTWTTRSGFWHRDAGFHRDAPDGRMTLELAFPRLGKVATEKPAGSPDPLVARLRRAVIDVHGEQTFVGLADGAPKPVASIHDIFVPLELRRRDAAEANERLSLEVLVPGWLRPAAEGKRAARAVILGDPGSGKSTLARYLAMRVAESEAPVVPLLLTVRDWVMGGGEEGMLDQARRYAASVLEIRTSVETLEQLCERGQAVLIVDGVDECSETLRVGLRDRLHGVASRYPLMPVLVTSRILGYDEAPLNATPFQHFVLEPFDDEQLRQFIERWYVVAESKNPVERQRKQAQLWSALEAEPRAKQMARTPLLATLLALVHFHRAQLPGERAQLYAVCIDTLVVTWPAARKRSLPELAGHRQLPMLEKLAFWMQSQRPSNFDTREQQLGVVVTRRQLDDQLEAQLADHAPESNEGWRRDLAHKWRRWLVADSGLLQESQRDRYSFVHLSLMEHLAGQAMLRQQGRKGNDAITRFVVEHHKWAAWRETLLLALGSRAEDRELGSAIMEAVTEINPFQFPSALFLLGVLREEIDVGERLCGRALDVVAALLSEYGPYTGSEVRAHIANILRFTHRHSDTVRRWIEAGLAERSDRALVGLLSLVPTGLPVVHALDCREEQDLGLVAFLDLDRGEWSTWARGKAKRSTLLTWVMGMPFARAQRRLFGNPTQLDSCLWVAWLLHQMTWVWDRVQRVVADSDALPRTLVTGTDMVHLAPSIRITCGAELSERGPAAGDSWQGDPVGAGYHAHFGVAFSTQIGRDLANLTIELRSASMSYIEARTEIANTLVRACLPPASPAWKAVLEALAGLVGNYATADEASRMARIRAANRALNTGFDLFVDTHNWDTPTPEKHALQLALGLAQYQTSWSWPTSNYWPTWFAGAPPEHWLPAHVWHLCRAVQEPDNPDHQSHAAACLARGDFPEFVDLLRQFELGPPDPEFLAHFSGPPIELPDLPDPPPRS
ncbi:metallophosphoesterase [Enhygromyxa salina]|uniref:3',5'-cyclic adenosine monophosphate phosphodiesterase CpdA n=1 Tax=Enhygromyxa salina TaxID=215803 RepID=A0A2S9YJD6_9BACT|nr:metallophosphoesterase [Enhygromyxa salina]PRQ05146.1 3',5'-cyclic adenosine monophosphate phosphodiesterase CpdA [Enhygromyxa salina]